MRNAQDFNTMASDKRWVNLMGAIQGARQDLKTLAPHPTRPDNKNPLFVRDNAKAANDDGALLANMMIGMFLGAHFGAAAHLPEWTKQINIMSTIDVYDAYQNDRTKGESNRGYELGNKGAIMGGFNMNTTHRPVSTEKEAIAWEAYMQDLPKRRIVEQSIGAMNHEIDRRERQMMRQHRQLAMGF